ncbi:MAG: hypothetical protein ACI80V_001491 [Rhodothermales bacterium]
MESLQVERPSWDSLLVVLHFEKPTSIRGQWPAPNHVAVTLFDSEYDTLYVGRDSVVHVPDGVLGSNEVVLVEACGVFNQGTVCEQRAIHSSPKRISATIEMDFPTDSETMSRGSYTLHPQLQRSRFGSTEWEDINDQIPDRLDARVRILDTEHDGMRVPMRLRGGRFDLGQAEGFRDFRFYLLSAFREFGEARVEFNLVTAYKNGTMPVGVSVVTVSQKSEEEKVAEVSKLAEAAGSQVLTELSSFLGTGRAYVFVNEWEYLSESKRYRIEVELHWRTPGGRAWHELVGRLETGEDGTRARFELTRANDEAERRWKSAVRGEVLSLGPLGRS